MGRIRAGAAGSPSRRLGGHVQGRQDFDEERTNGCTRRACSAMRRCGHNEALDSFPVGKRLAFDAAEGHLWVVCSRCERWNLSRLEERWEATEAAEKL